MFEAPDHYHNLSLRLSEVLNDIGVNERIVLKRRRSWMLTETIFNIGNQINGINESLLNFGSQNEGSTTLQLQSDVDLLRCIYIIKIIQDWSDWQFQPFTLQFLMVQDETTSPGYCLLQLLRFDVPLPLPHQEIPLEQFARDSRGRILMKHSFLFHVSEAAEGGTRHGPAQVEQGVPGLIDTDLVFAMFCSSWPKEAEPWLQQQNVSGWPTEDMKRYAVEHGCFVVPVASRESPYQDTEWRISTSHAERCLMFNINMTQMRCYILMKMILKTFFKPRCDDVISSFMCKNVLFHCIADSSASEWNDGNLIACLNQCLHVLCNCILTENCPHFIIPRNNLLAGKLSIPVKEQLIEIICNLTGNIGQSLLSISIDQLGKRLYVKSGGRILAGHLPSPELYARRVMKTLICFLVDSRQRFLKITLNNIHNKTSGSVYQSLIKGILTLCQIYLEGSKMEQIACLHWTPLFCTILGSIRASIDIYHSNALSPIAMMWFSKGLNSDFSSSRLKLASALYCAGHNEQCETILAYLSHLLEHTTMISFCRCYKKQARLATNEFDRLCNEKNEEDLINQNIALCVTFLPCETFCVPKELRYEFFRSTEEDRAYRDDEEDFWMDWATVDSLTYLHFMEYKVYTQLHRPVEQHRALGNLARTIHTELNLDHKETALNLLGQCMEQENRLNAALCCYMMSLIKRRRNNAAKWHICILFARLVRHRQ